MAKTSQVNRNAKRAYMAERDKAKRAALKATVMDRTLPVEERFDATLRLAQLPRNGAKVRWRGLRHQPWSRPPAGSGVSPEPASWRGAGRSLSAGLTSPCARTGTSERSTYAYQLAWLSFSDTEAMTNPAAIEFFFDVGSPYSYLAAAEIGALSARTGVPVRWRPFLLGAVFKASGNDMPARVAAKARFMLGDLSRWAAIYGVPFRMSSRFPLNTLRNETH